MLRFRNWVCIGVFGFIGYWGVRVYVSAFGIRFFEVCKLHRRGTLSSSLAFGLWVFRGLGCRV